MNFIPHLSTSDWLKVVGLVIAALVAGYQIGKGDAPPPSTEVLQWGGPDGCGFNFAQIPMSNWPFPDRDEPMVCRLVAR